MLASSYIAAPVEARNLEFSSPAKTWDEGMPLGNGTVGALVWSRNDTLRFSLDRTDLWDLRPNDSIAKGDYSFKWVTEHIRSGNYLPVQQKLDYPYDQFPTPTKIPGAALELVGLPSPDKYTRGYIDMDQAVARIMYDDGTEITSYVHADFPVGWICISGPSAANVTPRIVTPKYAPQNTAGTDDNSHAGQGLFSLGYPQGNIVSDKGHINYRQPGQEGFEYDVDVRYNVSGDTMVLVWSIGSTIGGCKAEKATAEAIKRGIDKDLASHRTYWDRFNGMSSISLPDSVLQRQYESEMYKLGSLARKDSYPISLQGVWTADNGSLPPWKGDYHHDLNTQLSYWPVYAGNHLEEGEGYLNTLWNQRDVYKDYTRRYFGHDGLNVPGVCTLTGEPMGGWIQYSMSQTAGAWLAQHFYLHWLYSADRKFLKKRAYPFASDVAKFIENQLVERPDGKLSFEFSSSPEYNDNSREAWFSNMTNYDLALSRWLFSACPEMAHDLGKDKEAAHWESIGERLPQLAVDDSGSLAIAPGVPIEYSHRHMSHVMSIHPLGLLDPSRGDSDVINASLEKLEKLGPDYWVGYSYAWFGALQATALHGDKARDALRTFAECFCLPNTFHVNGDQSRSGKSKFTYRPFTLEGNMAFAEAIQRMLLQSHTGVVRLFPAIPSDWRDVSFDSLRVRGGFLISAAMSDGRLSSAKAYSKSGGMLKIEIGGKVKDIRVPAGKWIDIPVQ